MIAIFFIVLIYLYCLILIIKTKLFLKYNCKNNNTRTETLNDKKLVIAIPCLREQNCIEDTIEYFREISNDIPIVIVTTQKEIFENKDINTLTTQDIVNNKILPKYKNVYCINYPYKEGYMADQLNYMIDNLDKIDVFKNFYDSSKTYLALYNADSKPNKNTFNEIIKKINEGNLVIQQYSYCFKNYNKLNSVLKGFSIYQSNFEFKTGLLNSFFKSKILYTHVVGHGLVINLKLLNDLGNFNNSFWCEDVYLSMQLKFKNINIVPLNCLENIETPSTLLSLIKQNSVWFKTTGQFGKIYKDIKKKMGFSFQGFIGCFNEFRFAINWLCFPIIIILTVLILFIKRDYILGVIFLFTYFMYVCINTALTISIINRLDNKRYNIKFYMVFHMFIVLLISNLGPLYSLFTRNKVKYKTER